MSQPDLSRAQWHKSSRSSANGQCVEVARLGQTVAVRDSKNPHRSQLVFTQKAWSAFLRAIKEAGSFLA